VPADYSTPEQQIGRMQTDRPWETCMTICDQWSWKPNDRLKSLEECIQTLVKVVGGDGNLLFNVGPMSDGQIEPRQVERLCQMGQWLNQYGESIYGTRGGPFWRGSWGVSTCKDNRIYLHLLDPAQETTVLPAIEKKIVGHRVLTGGTADVRQTDEWIEITMPPSARNPIDTIVVLELDGPAAEAHPSRAGFESLAFNKPAQASNVYQGMLDTYGPAKAVDDDPETRWATDAGTHEAWLEVDLGKPQPIGRAEIQEACGSRVEKFELQAKQGDAWTTFADGTTIGENLALEFDPVSAQVVRLNILSASEGPTLWNFQLLPPRKSSK
jgi:alpha-L-fucosidase